MSRLSTPYIESVFSYFLATKARELANAKVPGIEIIPTRNFPKGAPIHEDGSSEYDPRKKRAYFAVEITTTTMMDTWDEICAEFDALRSVA